LPLKHKKEHIKAMRCLISIAREQRRLGILAHPNCRQQWNKAAMHFSSESSSHAFDRDLKRLQRDGAARAHKIWASGSDDVVQYDYFHEEISRRLVDRLDDIRRDEGFPLALDVGAGPGYIYRAICADEAFDGVGGIGGVRKLVQLDASEEMLHRDENVPVDGAERCGTYRLVADEEERLPFPDGTFDLVISSISMHWVNDLPGLFADVKVLCLVRLLS
jgi:NADH dehydrogenase [ubiquinone] 1 alpha subcomplex assembly factor 5